jgi:hypothetical protein
MALMPFAEDHFQAEILFADSLFVIAGSARQPAQKA